LTLFTITLFLYCRRK